MSIYFLFLESLGTPELILIALVALIVFGPRKLPQIGRTIGKYTAEFKRASQDFRETWEREVQEVESIEKGEPKPPENSLAKLEADFMTNSNGAENTIGRGAPWAKASEPESFDAPAESVIALPEVRAVDSSEFHLLNGESASNEIIEDAEVVETAPQRKRDWL
jgi:TatA/E family protein of Tat protein translocase